MLKKILSFFYTDLHWKLISLGLAFVIWYVAMNLHDPLENRPNSANLQVRGIEIMERDGLVVVNADELRAMSINFSVRGFRSAFGYVSLDDFIVYVDMRSVNSTLALNADGPTIQRLPININLLSGFEFQSVRPAFVDVELDVRERRVFPLRVVELGSVQEGYELQSIQPTNTNVTVTAARETMNTICHVRVEVDLTDAGDEVDATIVVVDYDGEDITNQIIALSVSQTAVRVQKSPVRTLEIRVEPIGEMAPGFSIAPDGITTSELFINVVGSEDVLNDISYVLLQFNRDGLAESVERSISVADYLPEGLSLSKSAPENVIVAITVEPIQRRTFFVLWRDVFGNIYDALHQTINDPVAVRVVLSGPQSIINALQTSDLNVAFDLRNLPIGIQWVPLSVINLPTGVTLAEPIQPVEMQIFAPAQAEPDVNDEPMPEPTPTPTPTPDPTPAPTPEPTPPPEENGNGGNDDDNGNGDTYDPNDEIDPNIEDGYDD